MSRRDKNDPRRDERAVADAARQVRDPGFRDRAARMRDENQEAHRRGESVRCCGECTGNSCWKDTL